jgi:hypothetical protein
MIAHIGGMPVEETLLPWAGSASAGLLLARVAGTSAIRAWKRRLSSRRTPAGGRLTRAG